MRRAGAVVAAALGVAAAAGAADESALTADLGDRRIEITAGFTGAEVLLFGVRDGAGDVVAVLRGPEAPAVVRRKRRRFGLWLNHRRVVFDDVPGYYAVVSTRPLSDIASAAALAELGIGFGRRVRLPGGGAHGAEAAAFRDALARLMEAEGRYRVSSDGMEFVDERLFRGTFVLPSVAPTGRYRAEVLLIADGAVAGRHETELTVRKTGFGAAAFEFAHSHPLAYGLVAAVVALTVGWAAAMMFRRR